MLSPLLVVAGRDNYANVPTRYRSTSASVPDRPTVNRYAWSIRSRSVSSLRARSFSASASDCRRTNGSFSRYSACADTVVASRVPVTAR